MSSFIKKIQVGLKSIKTADLIYAGTVLVFIIIVAILFFTSVRFISKNVNDAFSTHPDSSGSLLNVVNYSLVAKKLGIDTAVKQLGVPQIPNVVATSTPGVVLDKKTI